MDLQTVNGKVPCYENRDTQTVHIIGEETVEYQPLNTINTLNEVIEIPPSDRGEPAANKIEEDQITTLCSSGFRPDGDFRGDEVIFLEEKVVNEHQTMCGYCRNSWIARI